MKDVYIVRTKSNEHGTFGHLIADEFQCYTLEPPVSGNIQCIPAGIYTVKWEPYGDFKGYAVKNTFDRTAIEIHIGNILSDTTGCILLGLEVGEREYSKKVGIKYGVWRSSPAINRFNMYMKHKDFRLEIINKLNQEI